MCLRRGLAVALLFLIAAVAVSVGGIARASHCSGDKDHLVDGSCGYYVQPAGPDPAITPTPTPAPTVHVGNFPNNQNVTISNWPTPGETLPPGSGWTVEDRATLVGFYDLLKHALGLLVLTAGVVLVLNLPRRS